MFVCHRRIFTCWGPQWCRIILDNRAMAMGERGHWEPCLGHKWYLDPKGLSWHEQYDPLREWHQSDKRRCVAHRRSVYFSCLPARVVTQGGGCAIPWHSFWPWAMGRQESSLPVVDNTHWRSGSTPHIGQDQKKWHPNPFRWFVLGPCLPAKSSISKVPQGANGLPLASFAASNRIKGETYFRTYESHRGVWALFATQDPLLKCDFWPVNGS